MADPLDLLADAIEAHARHLRALAAYRAAGPANLRELRRRLGLSQRQLAAHLDVHKTHVSRIENGREHMSIPLMELVCGLFAKATVDGRGRAERCAGSTTRTSPTT